MKEKDSKTQEEKQKKKEEGTLETKVEGKVDAKRESKAEAKKTQNATKVISSMIDRISSKNIVTAGRELTPIEELNDETSVTTLIGSDVDDTFYNFQWIYKDFKCMKYTKICS